MCGTAGVIAIVVNDAIAFPNRNLSACPIDQLICLGHVALIRPAMTVGATKGRSIEIDISEPLTSTMSLKSSSTQVRIWRPSLAPVPTGVL